MKTDRIILLLFIPWILLFIVPFTPFYKGVEHAYKLLFVIVLSQIGLVYTFSYLTIKALKDNNKRPNLKFDLRKFGVHTIINFCIISFWFVPIFRTETIKEPVLLIISLYLILFLSELLRLRNISAYIVSLEQNRKAKFKEYVYTFILLTSIYGIWNIHKRIKNLISNETTVPNN
jgi:amino acid transporter